VARAAQRPPGDAGSNPYRQLAFRHIGPVANRIAAVAGVIGNRMIYDAGSASGVIFKTTDGGATWQKVLFVDENTGCSDVAMDPGNPRILFAGMWQFAIHTWRRTGGGPRSGLFKSIDGGATRTRLTGHGLPGSGSSARLPSQSPGATRSACTRRSRRVRASPGTLSRPRRTNCGDPTTAGGHTLGAPPLGDFHDIWIDPGEPDRMVVSNDGSIGVTLNPGPT
jgi:hypothetical protein